MTRSVDDIDQMAVPLSAGSSSSDGDAALTLLLHPIHRGGTLVYFANLVGDTRVVENSLSHSGLASINVRNNSNVTNALNLIRPGHGFLLNPSINHYQR